MTPSEFMMRTRTMPGWSAMLIIISYRPPRSFFSM